MLSLIDGHCDGLNRRFYRVALRRRCKLVPERHGLVQQSGQVANVRLLPVRFMVLVLPLSHDVGGFRRERDHFDRRRPHEVVLALRVPRKPHHAAILRAVIDYVLVAKDRNDWDVGAGNDLEPVRRVALFAGHRLAETGKRLDGIHLHPVDDANRLRAPGKAFRYLLFGAFVNTMNRSIRPLADVEGLILNPEILADPNALSRKPVAVAGRRKVRHRGDCRLRVHRPVLVNRDVLELEPVPRVREVQFLAIRVRVDLESVLDPRDLDLLIEAPGNELRQNADKSPAVNCLCLRSRVVGRIGFRIHLNVTAHPFQNFGIINGRIVNRIDLDRWAVLALFVRYLLDELRHPVDDQARSPGLSPIRFHAGVPLHPRVELTVDVRFGANVRPRRYADVEPGLCQRADANPGIPPVRSADVNSTARPARSRGLREGRYSSCD